jgi:hypothetical protein
LTSQLFYDIIIIERNEREVNKMLRTLNYGELVIVEPSIIRIPYDTLVDTIETEDETYDIYSLAEDGSLVAVLDEALED